MLRWNFRQFHCLLLDCKVCKDDQQCPNTKCCARRILSEEYDFKNQKIWLEETVNAHEECSIIFFPKFHCELNFIEMVWGYMKSCLRRDCKFDFKALHEQKLPNILSQLTHSRVISRGVVVDEEAPKIGFIRRASRHCFRFMSGYRQGLHGPLLDYAMKKYKGHRMIKVLSEDEKKELARQHELYLAQHR